MNGKETEIMNQREQNEKKEQACKRVGYLIEVEREPSREREREQ